MKGVVGGVILGFALGAGLFAVARRGPEPTPPPPAKAAAPSPPPPEPKHDPHAEEHRKLVDENRKLREEIAELKNVKPAIAEADKKLADPGLDKEFEATFAKLVKEGMAAFQKPEFAEVLGKLKAAGKDGVAFVLKALKSDLASERFLGVTLLMLMEDSSGVGAAIESLRSDKDLLVRRQAAHAVGKLGTDAAPGALREAMTGDKDWGVKANSAYWLAKLGHEDGLRVLEQSYASPETPPEYRAAVLGGLADVAAPTTAPLFRKILSEAKDETYLLLAIMALEKMKDSESLPGLRRIETSDAADSIKEAARKAVATIGP